jgi:hypothetical protein
MHGEHLGRFSHILTEIKETYNLQGGTSQVAGGQAAGPSAQSARSANTNCKISGVRGC